MNPDTAWIIGTVITVDVALASVMYALVNGTHRRIDDVRAENREAHAGITKNIDGVKQDIRDVKQERPDAHLAAGLFATGRYQ